MIIRGVWVITPEDHKSVRLRDINILCFLIYGPNEGLVRDQINKLKNNYSTKYEYEEIKISAKELDEDSYILDNTLKTPSMFYKGKVLVIDSPKDKHLSSLEPMINDAPQDSVIIVKSDRS